jgi:tetratricopeptide (TPR) repeat protein
VYAMLAGCYMEQGRVDEAKTWLERGLNRFPQDPELLFRAGIIYRETGELERAASSYLKLLGERETGHIDSLDVTMTGFKAHHNLALIFLVMGRAEGVAGSAAEMGSGAGCRGHADPTLKFFGAWVAAVSNSNRALFEYYPSPLIPITNE